MPILVKPNIKNSKLLNDPHSNIARKWSEIEKKQKRNASTKAKINDLYQRFQQDVLPQEQKLTELLAQETRHLMSFMPRKSLNNWQRDELHCWIESNLDLLASHPFASSELTATLRKEYSEILLNCVEKVSDEHQIGKVELDNMRDMCEEMFDGEQNFSDEELEEFLRDPAIFQKKFQDFLSSSTEEEKDDESFNANPFDDDFDPDDESFYEHKYHNQQAERNIKQQNKLNDLFNTSKLNKLYKILANRLHPDKEMNEQRKEHKQQLMAQLVNAKKNKDAFTLISMYHQYVDDSELNLFDDDDTELSQSLIRLLNLKLDQLDRENEDYKRADGIPSMVWQKFGGRGKKAIEENIAIHLADLEDDYSRSYYYIHEVTNLKLLKEILADRYEERRYSPFSGGALSLDDLFF